MIKMIDDSWRAPEEAKEPEPPVTALDCAAPSDHIAPMLITIEKTPNPATRKFLPGLTVLETGGRDFATADAAAASPLAEALFATGMVDGVYFGRDFVSVSAAPSVEWDHLEADVVSVLLDHFMLDAPLFRQAPQPKLRSRRTCSGVRGQSGRRRHHRSDQGIDRYPVRPAVAQDGGDIVYRGYKDGTLYLGMQGACSGCPSSTVTLKRGVESLIKHYVPEVETIEAV